MAWPPAAAPPLLLLLLLLVGLAPPLAGARPIKYFDLTSRHLPLPDPPGLTLGPIGNATLRETRDVVVLADGASSAAPMQAWDAALLRTFVVGAGHHMFLTLLNVGTGRVFHLDLGEIEVDLNHKRISSGGACTRSGAGAGHLKRASNQRYPLTDPHPPTTDFNGDTVPDLAVGVSGAIEMIYLQDSVDDPILAQQRIERTDADLGLPEWVPFTAPDQPFTDWPVRLLTIPDMDKNGVDELWCVQLVCSPHTPHPKPD